MDPVGLEKVGRYHWVKKFDGFELQTRSLQGMVGEWWVGPDLTISTGSQPVIIERMELETPKGGYPANRFIEPQLVPPHSKHETIRMYWEFREGMEAPQILGDVSRIVFHLKVAGKEKLAEIWYRRAECCE
jgi:hypothetical protein